MQNEVMDMNEDIINLPDYDRKKKKGKFINVIGILAVVAYISFLVSACNFKPDSSGQGISITTESRDENGFLRYQANNLAVQYIRA